MDAVSSRVNSQLQTIRRCISVAFQQARQSEIEVPLKRQFRLPYETGNAPAADQRDSSPGKRDLLTRTGAELKTFRKSFSEAIRQARLVENDRFAQKHYGRLFRAGDLASPTVTEETHRTGSTAGGGDPPDTCTTQPHSGMHGFQRGWYRMLSFGRK